MVLDGRVPVAYLTVWASGTVVPVRWGSSARDVYNCFPDTLAFETVLSDSL
jgi:hypothetical protein